MNVNKTIYVLQTQIPSFPRDRNSFVDDLAKLDDQELNSNKYGAALSLHEELKSEYYTPNFLTGFIDFKSDAKTQFNYPQTIVICLLLSRYTFEQ